MKGKWKVIPLVDLCRIVMGQSPNSSGYNTNGCGLPLIQGNADISNGKTLHRIYTRHITKQAPKGSIILTVRAPVGNIAISNEEVCLGRGVCSIIPLDTNLDFLKYSLIFFERFWKRYEQGSTFTAVGYVDVSRFEIPVPDLDDVQQHIADILTSCDEVIEQTEKAIAKYRDIKAGMLQDLFTRGLDANGKLRPKPEDAPGLYKDSPLGKIPKEWDCYPMEALCDFFSGCGFPERFQGHKIGKYPFVKVSDMNLIGNEIFLHNANNWISESVATKLSAKIAPASAIAFAKIGAAMLLNRIRVTLKETCFDNNMMFAVPKNTEYMFLYYIFAQIDFADFVQTTALPSLNLNKFKVALYIVPSRDEQIKIINLLSSIDDKIALEKKILDKYRSIKLGLMKKLLTPPEGALEA